MAMAVYPEAVMCCGIATGAQAVIHTIDSVQPFSTLTIHIRGDLGQWIGRRRHGVSVICSGPRPVKDKKPANSVVVAQIRPDFGHC
jgi:hypothetical protein